MADYSMFDDTEDNEKPVEIAGAGLTGTVTIDNLRLKERWWADDTDIGLFKRLGQYFSAHDNASRCREFPGTFELTPEYRKAMGRGSVGEGSKAKTLLAIIMELPKVSKMTTSQYVGSLVDDVDLGLETLKEVGIPALVRGLAAQAGYDGYEIPQEIQNETNPAKRKEMLLQYTSQWILRQFQTDPIMKSQLEWIED